MTCATTYPKFGTALPKKNEPQKNNNVGCTKPALWFHNVQELNQCTLMREEKKGALSK